ncbi:g6000 [Coccomyxa elongata]
MLGADLPATGTLLPLRDVSMAEMPPNVTVTLKRKRSKQHASLGHLTKVMGTMNGPDKATLHASAAGSREADSGAAPEPRKQSGARLLARRSGDMAVTSPINQPPSERQRPVPLRNRARPGPAALLHRPVEAAAAAPPRKPQRSEGARERRPAGKEEPQRKLRHRGGMSERLAAILENERSPCSEESGEEEEWCGSHQGASPSAVTGCKLSKAACRAQGAMHQLSNEEVLEAEAELSPGATEEEREAAYRRVKNRSAARKTRRKKVEKARKLQEQVQSMGKRNRDLINHLKHLLNQRELYNRENAQLKGLLQHLQSQPETARMTPSLANLDAVRNGMVSSRHDIGAAGAPNHRAPAVVAGRVKHRV